MCGRYELNATPRQIRDHLEGLEPSAHWDNSTSFSSFNIAPSLSPIVIRQRKGENQVDSAVWGFRPHWANKSWINARSETLFTLPTFRESARRRRCLAIATGWYEWKAIEPGKPKQPYYFHFSEDCVFAFAGVWTARKLETEWEVNFAIITTDAQGIARDIHNRMPLVMHPRRYAEWLHPETKEPQSLLAPFDTGELTAYPVSTYVNDPRNDGPKCVERARAEGEGRCLQLKTKQTSGTDL